MVKSLAEFNVAPPIITGDNYDQRTVQWVIRDGQLNIGGMGGVGDVRITTFNIGKINSEVRGGKSPPIKRLSEYIGESYFDYLTSLPDLVLLMDENHHYRAVERAINELRS